ncbi:hypothetical protein [Streptomyces sp. NPDC059783]|uniref:hypothetical protein n=1 Tax=Streptomyces sp. NPDC059783 TaxID=3346944 RepID=UPI0036591C19
MLSVILLEQRSTMDRRLIQTAVFGGPDSDDPAVCPEAPEEMEEFRRRHANDTIWCGTKFEGGCGRRLTTRLCTGKICHFAHYATTGSGEQCGRKARDKDSANHLFAKAHFAAWLTGQGLTAEFSFPEPLGSAVQVALQDGRNILLHLDRRHPVSWDNASWEIILGPGVPVPSHILKQRGYVQRLRFEDRAGGGRSMRLGTEQPGVGTTWDDLESTRLTDQGLNTTSRPQAVRAPVPTQSASSYGETDGRSIVTISPAASSRRGSAKAVRQDDAVKRVLLRLDRALRDQPEHLYNTVSAVRRLMEMEEAPENVGRLRLALDRGNAALEQRHQQRRAVLDSLRARPTERLLATVAPLMRDHDVTAAEREAVRAAQIQVTEEKEARRRREASLRAVREEERAKKRTAEQEQRRADQLERLAAAKQAELKRDQARQRAREQAAERQAQIEREQRLGYLAPFLGGALKKAARERRVTTWDELGKKTGQRALGRLAYQDRLAILEIVEKGTAPDAPVLSAVLAATGSDDALRLHRDLLQRLRRPAADDDTALLAEVHAQCVRLSQPW